MVSFDQNWTGCDYLNPASPNPESFFAVTLPEAS